MLVCTTYAEGRTRAARRGCLGLIAVSWFMWRIGEWSTLAYWWEQSGQKPLGWAGSEMRLKSLSLTRWLPLLQLSQPLPWVVGQGWMQLWKQLMRDLLKRRRRGGVKKEEKVVSQAPQRKVLERCCMKDPVLWWKRKMPKEWGGRNGPRAEVIERIRRRGPEGTIAPAAIAVLWWRTVRTSRIFKSPLPGEGWIFTGCQNGTRESSWRAAWKRWEDTLRTGSEKQEKKSLGTRDESWPT